jgi:hypothetical protein
VRETFGWRRVAEGFASICENTVNKKAVKTSVEDEDVVLSG